MSQLNDQLPESALPNLRYYSPVPKLENPETIHADVVIYGSSSGAVTAAVQASRSGLKVVIVAFGKKLGGMSAGGLGFTDFGSKDSIGGISREFYRTLGKHYGNSENWTFEPSAAEKVFEDWILEYGISVYREHHLSTVEKKGERITSITCENGNKFVGRVFIDATYEGDLFANAGCSYHLGREANSVYREKLNGIYFGHLGHTFKAWVDPYKVPGDPSSGYIYGVQDVEPGTQGYGDATVQAYNFRICFTDDPANMAPLPKPVGYDPSWFEMLARYLDTGIWDTFRLTKPMPNRKTDTNNQGAVSSDYIGFNYDWPEGDYLTREQIFQDHVRWNLGMYYFLQNDARVPVAIREEMNQWGLPRDEFVDSNHWPHELYVREGRRLLGEVVMTERHCRHFEVEEDSIGLAAYTMDSHCTRRLVIDGRLCNEGVVEYKPKGPYAISYRALTPKREEVTNLLVSTCLSCSHIAYGSIRMEPVFMVLGQSAATAAALAISADCDVQKIDYSKLRKKLIEDNQVLDNPY